MNLSVVTCTYKPELRTLKRVWKSLLEQSIGPSSWEYVVVQNDGLDSLEGCRDLECHPRARCLSEPAIGLAQARMRGVRETTGDIIVFVDQDNILFPDYLENVMKLMETYSFLGALGAVSIGECDVCAPDWAQQFLDMFGFRKEFPQGQPEIQYALVHASVALTPMGAGLAVRRPVAEHYQRYVLNAPTRQSFGRAGSALMGSEDVDLAYTAMDLGLAWGVSSRLRLIHMLEPFRIHLPYLRNWLYGSNYSSARLLLARGWKQPIAAAPPTLRSRLQALKRRWFPESPEMQCWRAWNQGYRDGLSGLPPDPQYDPLRAST